MLQFEMGQRGAVGSVTVHVQSYVVRAADDEVVEVSFASVLDPGADPTVATVVAHLRRAG